MSKVFSALSVSVDGYISGRTREGEGEVGRGLGDGSRLFDWYSDGDTPSATFDGFRLSEASARVFDAAATRVGAVVAGHTTYVHSSHFGDGGPHPTAPLFVLSSGPVPELGEGQTLVTTGIVDAIAAARGAAGDDKDVVIMGGRAVTSALAADLVDEVILHQIPILLGGGHRFFGQLPDHVNLRLLEATQAPGVIHLHYEVVR